MHGRCRLRGQLTAFAPEAVGFAHVGGMAIVGPFFPTDIQLLNEKPLLRQLQSRSRRSLSIVAGTVRNDFHVFRKNGY